MQDMGLLTIRKVIEHGAEAFISRFCMRCAGGRFLQANPETEGHESRCFCSVRSESISFQKLGCFFGMEQL
jgi:hypothetical protein